MADISKNNNGPRVEETTPLLARETATERDGKRGKPVVVFLMLCAFLVSLTFGITQVPMLYVFRKMVCEAYYEDHMPDPEAGDICANHEVEAGTARAIALMAVSTTVFGLLNLIVTGWTIKRLGVKRALIVQIFWPAVRLTIQNIGIVKGSNAGVLIMQSSQIITIVGGPNGYVLCLNSFVADVVRHEERTGSLGRLQGCMYFGAAIGFLVGGLVGDAYGIAAPFRITLVLFLLCCVYVAVSLPTTTPPQRQEDALSSQAPGIVRFFGPLRIFAPQKWTLADGRTSTQFGALTLGVGVYLGILATGYIPTLLQLYAAYELDFGTKANGYLIFIYSSLRGAFLSLVFPRIIAAGRKWLQPDDQAVQRESQEEQPLMHDIPTSPNEIGPIDSMENDVEPINPPQEQEDQTFAFDLLYTRISLLLDGVLTLLAVFISRGWQLYLLAFLLPFSGGTGAASKGSILQMLPSGDRVDALGGITLVENMARLSTTAVFGLVFAALAEVGKSRYVFVCNAAVALLGFGVLLFSRFPPQGSRRV
ncbi:MFS general substrate transporter [Dothidotthia symphoricarpi CBS 119687]|uniref:MFS general substrate transporter n=1 Tax=Dothidotthia symphoricarpi CBS 119687 TaxID=1392245 RepID=A0A6A6AA06_9PLEO|nr:MFS general substrate transporter [Dothidotthia symphoricarpi CBS 119687]KAF2128762.1 MFS general substrate transporter [Dothidotthia symphoricarpi CBS 119687]